MRQKRVDIRTPEGFALLVEGLAGSCVKAQDALERLRDFCWTEPRFPDAAARTFRRDQPPLGIEVGMERAEIVARLESLRPANEFAELAFYAYRDLNRTEPEPFLKAALERCPVSIAATACSGRRRAADHCRGAGRRVHLRRARPSGSAGRGLELRSWRRGGKGAAARQHPPSSPSWHGPDDRDAAGLGHLARGGFAHTRGHWWRRGDPPF